MTQQLQTLIDNAWDNRASLSPSAAPKEIQDAVEHVIAELNNGTLRVATREGVGQWTVHQWIKKAVLLSFRLKDNEVVKAGDLGFYDKVQTKFAHLTEEEMKATGVRVVPPAVARRGRRQHGVARAQRVLALDAVHGQQVVVDLMGRAHPRHGIAHALVLRQHVERCGDAAEARTEGRREAVFHVGQRDLGAIRGGDGILADGLQDAGEIVGEGRIDLQGDAGIQARRRAVARTHAFFGLEVRRDVGLVFGGMGYAQGAEATQLEHLLAFLCDRILRAPEHDRGCDQAVSGFHGVSLDHGVE